MRRQWAAAEARELGWGGITLVANATGLSRPTITAGVKELKLSPKKRAAAAQRVRRSGAGRKRLLDVDPDLASALEALIEPVTRGDPESPLRWACKSTRRLAEELTRQNQPVSDRTVATLLKECGYSLQANRKTREGGSHPDRNAQFEYINAYVGRFQKRDRPAISVDANKKELVGDFKNAGREWRPQGMPEEVRVHDFQDKLLGKAIPYGVYDMLNNQGWVSVGIDHDTARFAVNSCSVSLHRIWREKPLVSHQAIINLIANTKTRKGLIVRAALDTNQYELTIKVPDEELARVNLKRHKLQGDWNYTISPRKKS